MLVSPRVSLALGVGCAFLVLAPSALAAGPATVTVRVEGATQTLVPPTQVTTTTALVVKDGKPEDACPGTNAVGALELATAGNWSGRWFGGGIKEGKFEGNGYSVEMVAGESHAFGTGAFWDVWLNNKEATEGLCKAELEPGSQVLLFPCAEVAPCPIPLGIEAPSSAGVGEPVAVAVKKYNEKGEPSPAAGATITGGAAPATADSSGDATVSFPSAGQVPLRVTASGLVRTETTVCVHAGNDGTCGTSAVSGSSSTTTTGASGTLGARTFVGPKAIAAELTGLIDGHRYRRGGAPRVLAGKVTAPTPVASISLRLRRTYRGRCWAYDGARERFLRVRCRRGSFFRVAPTGDSFSYLLPSRLAAGRYVLDIKATDAAGDQTALVRGKSRFVFYVA